MVLILEEKLSGFNPRTVSISRQPRPRRRSRAGARGKGSVADSERGPRPVWIASEQSGFGSPQKERHPQGSTRHLV